MASAGVVEGGQIIPVEVKESQVKARLIGPDNTFRKGVSPSTEPFTVSIDPLAPVAMFAVQYAKLVLREGEWIHLVRIQFQLIPFYWERPGHLSLLSQANPSPVRALCFTHQH